jgi:hydroxyacylglutathione hydrolase
MLEIVTLVVGPIQSNAYLVGDRDTSQAVVIDPGGDGEKILMAAAQRKWKIGSIWLTHAHFDHLAGAASVSDGSSPPAPVALHPEDYWLWRNQGGAPLFGLRLDPGPEPTIDLFHGQVLHLGGSSIEVRHTPGHTKGHVIFYCSSEKVAFCGDTVFKGSIGRTDLPGGDFSELMDSIHREILSLPDETRILSGHGPETTVGAERRYNPFLQENL